MSFENKKGKNLSQIVGEGKKIKNQEPLLRNEGKHTVNGKNWRLERERLADARRNRADGYTGDLPAIHQRD